MDSTRIQYGATERIMATILNSSNAGYTGLSDVLLEIRRRSDGKYFDFSDKTFKSAAWTTRQGAMTELNATYSAGVYYYDFNTTGHSSAYTEEDYFIRVTSVSGGSVPNEGELHVGGYVNQIGVFEGGGRGGYGDMSKKQMIDLAKMVWEVILQKNESARDVLLSRSDFDAAKDKVILKEKIDFKPVIKPIVNIPPAPPVYDYLPELRQILTRVNEIRGTVATLPDPTDQLDKIISMLMTIDSSTVDVKPMLEVLQKAVDDISSVKGDYAKQAELAKGATDKVSGMMNEMQRVKDLQNAPPPPPEPTPEPPPPPKSDLLDDQPTDTLTV
jgi:hypothetical protein